MKRYDNSLEQEENTSSLFELCTELLLKIFGYLSFLNLQYLYHKSCSRFDIFFRNIVHNLLQVNKTIAITINYKELNKAQFNPILIWFTLDKLVDPLRIAVIHLEILLEKQKEYSAYFDFTPCSNVRSLALVGICLQNFKFAYSNVQKLTLKQCLIFTWQLKNLFSKLPQLNYLNTDNLQNIVFQSPISNKLKTIRIQNLNELSSLKSLINAHSKTLTKIEYHNEDIFKFLATEKLFIPQVKTIKVKPL